MAALKATVFLHLASVWFFVSCAPNEQNCSEVNCKILPGGENLASEFELKASEKGVRMIYLNLKIGNDSYNPLELQDEILPDRWVWARSNSEPMLSLPNDYDILSLGLLNYQVQSMTVPLRDQPSGCLARLNSTCQNMAVGRALLDNVTLNISGELSPKSEVVCVAMIEKKNYTNIRSIKYHCCSANGSAVYCDLPVEGSNWFNAFKIVLGILSFVLLEYCPALLLMLPDCIFNLQDECDKEDCTEDQLINSEQTEPIAILIHTRNGYEQIQNEEEGRLTNAEIPVDDASPVTCSTLLRLYVQRLPDISPSFNVKLTVLLFCICPFFVYVHLGLYLTLKQKFILECFMKSVDASKLGFTFVWYINSSVTFIALSVLVFTCFMLVLCLRPKDLFLQKKAMKDCSACSIAGMMSITPLTTENSTDSINICDKMLQHLKLLQEVVYFLMSFFLKLHNNGLTLLTIKFNSCSLLKKINRDGSRIIRALFILWGLLSTLSTLFFGLVLGAICLLLLVFFLLILVLFICSPSSTLIIFFMFKIYAKLKASFCNRQLHYLVLAFCLIYALFLQIYIFSIISRICYFIVGMIGFTIMGLVLNVEIVTPYLAFFLVVTTNMYFCYANLQSRCKDVKGFILEYWKQELKTTNSDQSTIPTKLFWLVCDREFPVKTEICLMFRNMSVILTFLFLAISSIVFFGNTYNISTLVSTIAVFISGTIPSLFFKGLTRGKHFTGREKIKLKREIETAVKEYLRQSGRDQSEEGRSLDDNFVAM